MFGKEFLSAEKASTEFRTPLWEILATPLILGISWNNSILQQQFYSILVVYDVVHNLLFLIILIPASAVTPISLNIAATAIT